MITILAICGGVRGAIFAALMILALTFAGIQTVRLKYNKARLETARQDLVKERANYAVLTAQVGILRELGDKQVQNAATALETAKKAASDSRAAARDMLTRKDVPADCKESDRWIVKWSADNGLNWEEGK